MNLTKKHKKPMSFSAYFSLLFLTLTWANYTQAAPLGHNNDTGLVVTPERCVALRQGQTCYQEVIFSWRQPQKGNYCLVNLSTKQVLTCWQNANQGKFNLDFQATQSSGFAMRAENQKMDLSTTQITVSWVFKSSKRPRSSWKLF